jgi:pyruvate/2-oxoglutarate dehydrogenase complex dihydrolipoamide dehydrogenase (E3) component
MAGEAVSGETYDVVVIGAGPTAGSRALSASGTSRKKFTAGV